MNVYKQFVKFLQEVKVELGKVSWSTRHELIGSTTVVIALTSIICVFIYIVDTILAGLLNTLLKM